MAQQKVRTHRLQVHVSHDDRRAIEEFRFREHLPIRELLRRGLVSDDREEAQKYPKLNLEAS